MHPVRRRAISRREFLRRTGGAAIAVPSLAAILEACAKPGAPTVSGGVNVQDLLTHPARPDHPVTLPLYEEPIAASTPIEQNATLKLYNWNAYIWPHLAKAKFEEKYAKYNVTVEISEVSDIYPAIQKLSSGQVQADVFFPDPSELTQLALQKLVKPLQHELIPNLAANYWPNFQNPFYDQGWRYSVPYTIYTTGIAYRRDHVSDEDVAGLSNPYEILWDPKWKDKVTIYDDVREAIGMSLLKNGITDVNTGDENSINTAKEDLLKLINQTSAALTINGVYKEMAHDVYWVGQSWSGDIADAFLYYAAPGTPDSAWGYWYPPGGGGMIGNDLIVIPKSGQNPRLAHEFLNFMLDDANAYGNFVNWNGYQPPLNSLDPSKLVGKVYPRNLEAAVVQPNQFDTGHFLLGLTPAATMAWNNAWDEIKAGA